MLLLLLFIDFFQIFLKYSLSSRNILVTSITYLSLDNLLSNDMTCFLLRMDNLQDSTINNILQTICLLRLGFVRACRCLQQGNVLILDGLVHVVKVYCVIK